MFRMLSRLLAVLIFAASSAAAQDPTALQVTTADGTTVSFAVSDLDAMQQVSITTSTIWTEGEITFTGPSLTEVLDAANISANSLTLTALNDYAIEMPAPEAGTPYPIIATRMDGAAMSVRDKGPFWVVFPYDSDAEYQTETVYAQSIWQLDRIDPAE